MLSSYHTLRPATEKGYLGGGEQLDRLLFFASEFGIPYFGQAGSFSVPTAAVPPYSSPTWTFNDKLFGTPIS